MSVRFVIDPHRAGFDQEALLASLTAIEQASFSDPWRAQSFDEALKNPVITLTALYDADVLLGYALFCVIAPEAELLNLAVAPAARRLGYGERLLDNSFLHLRSRAVEDVFLEVREHNSPARGLYEKKGFRSVGRRKAYYHFPTEDAIVMMAHLDG
ncbi:MAG: ribosomal protein S18-alanine N-acetyltransferase [Clostridia bacterium]|nr:ribosomal protein S18-alanine N-acetyltransferase [Clostridia bacterium]